MALTKQSRGNAGVVTDSVEATAPAGSPGSEGTKPKRTVTIKGQQYPVAFSRRNPRTNVTFDYVERTREVTADVADEETGLITRRKQRVTFYVKKARPAVAEPTSRDGMVAVED